MGKPKQKFDLAVESDPIKVHELGKKKRFHPHDLVSLRPQNPRQEQFLIDYYSQVPMILQYGAAGTGKTTMAMYAALSEVFDASTPYTQLHIIRSAVSCRDQGFLPGDLEEKSAPFEEPYDKAADDLLKYNNPYNNLKALGYITFRTTANLRGLNFEDAVVFIDEVQNFEREELLTVLTRGSHNTRILISGDSKQDDLRGRKGQVSGFGYLLELMDNMNQEMVSKVEYSIDDCLRSPLVKEILKADSGL